MILEIQDIDLDTVELAIAGLRAAGLRALAEAIMLWVFHLDWDELPDTPVNDDLIRHALRDCHHYNLKLGDLVLERSTEPDGEHCDDI